MSISSSTKPLTEISWRYNLDDCPKDKTIVDILIESHHYNAKSQIIRQTDAYYCAEKQDWYLSSLKAYLNELTGTNKVIAWMFPPEIPKRVIERLKQKMIPS